MDKKILELLHSRISERITTISESLVGGVAEDYAEYRRLCGVVTGLLTAQREIQDLATKLKETDED
jgi:hypothetical protein